MAVVSTFAITNAYAEAFPSGSGLVLPTSDSFPNALGGGDGRDSNVLGQLRKITTEGKVSGVMAHRYGLGGVATDVVGNTYVGEISFTGLLPSCNPDLASTCHSLVNGGTVWKMSPKGEVSRVWTSSTVTPERIAIDDGGNLYVGMTHAYVRRSPSAYRYAAFNEFLVKLPPEGRVLGQFEDSGLIDTYIRDFTVDAQGNLVIASNNRIRKISPAGVTTEFGLAGSPGAVDGPGDTARFSEISGLAFDTPGNIFVADIGNHAIRKISPAGIVSTVVGRLGSSGIALGDLPGSLYQPNGWLLIKRECCTSALGDAILKVKLP